MVTGEEHARRALRAASVVAGARTLVIQADHEVTEVKQLLEEATSGSANDLALSALRAIWAAEDVLGEARTLLQRSADEADAYVDQIAPGLRRARSVAPSPVPGDRLLEPRPKPKSARGILDGMLRQSGDVEGFVKPVSQKGEILLKGIEPPPPGRTVAGTSQPAATPAPPTAGHADVVVAVTMSALVVVKGAEVAYDRARRSFGRLRHRLRRNSEEREKPDSGG
jgi:hypothetical protein